MLVGLLPATLFCAALLAYTPASDALSSSCQTPSGRTLASFVRVVNADGSSASGVVIAPGTVVTVAHALDQDFSTQVEILSEMQQARVLAYNKQTDVAILAANTQSVAAIPLSTKDLKAAEPVWAIGYPLAQALTISKGWYKRIMNNRLFTSTHADSGSSGGGLLHCNNGQHELAGVVHGYVAYVENGQYVNTGNSTSVTADQIRELLQASQLALAPRHKSGISTRH